MNEENKPVIIGGISSATLITLFQAILQLGKVSGWWGEFTDDEFQAWMTVAQIAIPILVIAGTTWWTARRTTSLAHPTDEDGIRLVRADTKEPAKQEVRSIERALRAK